MAQIEIPFRPDMALAVVEGRKYCTSRNQKYGEPGDTFLVEHTDGVTLIRNKCVLLGHTKLPLKFVAAILYDLEGLDSPADFKSIWKEIHPKSGWTPERQVWVHWFNRTLDSLETPAKRCKICGKEFARGMTLWPCGPFWVHPECIEGRPIDNED